VFPAIFTDQANGRQASALIEIEAEADTAVLVLADAQAAITSTGSRVSPSVLPFTLPTQFI